MRDKVKQDGFVMGKIVAYTSVILRLFGFVIAGWKCSGKQKERDKIILEKKQKRYLAFYQLEGGSSD